MLCICINNTHAVCRKGLLHCVEGLEMALFCLKSTFALDKINTALYSCGHESLLSIFRTVPSFDLHSNPMKLDE